jgi:hypothetical protein
MGIVVTTGATITCDLKGMVTQPGGPAKLKVGGAAVATTAKVSGWSTAACQAMAGNTKSPCDSVGAPTAGTATKLKVSGAAVLLDSLSAPANTGTAPDPVAHKVSVNVTASSKLKAG